ncbi:MAG: hypothetical protein ABIK97_06545 [candidate division WOR-3 bacterium]
MSFILFTSFLFNLGQWVSYCNEYPDLFVFYGPEKAMLINPSDFGITYPLTIESLRTRFYSSMGGFTDSAFVYKIYAGDGQTLLFESETLIALRPPQHFRYALRNPVVIESGNFYVAIASRTYREPFGYPFIATDDNSTPQKSFYGLPGRWTLSEYGEYFIFAFVSWTPTGEKERKGEWIGGKRGNETIKKIYNVKGELLTESKKLPPGVYFLKTGDKVRKVIKL